MDLNSLFEGLMGAIATADPVIIIGSILALVAGVGGAVVIAVKKKKAAENASTVQPPIDRKPE